MSSNFYHHGGNIEEESKLMKVKVNQILDASASLVPFECPKPLERYLKKSISTHYFKNYPDRSHQDLKQAISKWHRITPEMVLPGNGASELFTWAAKEASQNGLNSIPAPGFADYSRALDCWNGNYIHNRIPINWNKQGPQNFPISPKAEVIWITNPHNPTGQLWNRKSLETLLKEYKLIICDEAFLPLVPNGEKESLIPLVKNNPNLIVIRSLTKLYSIAGLRIGYAVSNPLRLQTWHKARDPWPLNGLAIAAGIKIFSNTDDLILWTKKVQKWVKKEGDWFYSNLKKIEGIEALPSSANFFLIKGNLPLINIQKQLKEQLILTRDCRSFIGLNENYLRISLQKHKGNKRIIASLKKIITAVSV